MHFWIVSGDDYPPKCGCKDESHLIRVAHSNTGGGLKTPLNELHIHD